ncbi:hypothetical protein BU23DRAFT_570135 [Bimuria novae-zelandiae CBS 107.79]|uniref:Uncharacterized protein n=1 Tax=Bimuria novae-zelandiae CBS 107.79 TaxID=1447943 RepID=A0A6A5V2A1_9PLEO|nr:hypothetical protein BU23DRAFT_570135 [Bimuria novae-zelandiae CBS 107.79]
MQYSTCAANNVGVSSVEEAKEVSTSGRSCGEEMTSSCAPLINLTVDDDLVATLGSTEISAEKLQTEPSGLGQNQNDHVGSAVVIDLTDDDERIAPDGLQVLATSSTSSSHSKSSDTAQVEETPTLSDCVRRGRKRRFPDSGSIHASTKRTLRSTSGAHNDRSNSNYKANFMNWSVAADNLEPTIGGLIRKLMEIYNDRCEDEDQGIPKTLEDFCIHWVSQSTRKEGFEVMTASSTKDLGRTWNFFHKEFSGNPSDDNIVVELWKELKDAFTQFESNRLQVALDVPTGKRSKSKRSIGR